MIKPALSLGLMLLATCVAQAQKQLGDDGSCHGSDDCGTELVGDGPCDCSNELA